MALNAVLDALYHCAQLIAAVEEMRDAQRSYFKTRNRDTLFESKKLEKKVDNLLVELEKLKEHYDA